MPSLDNGVKEYAKQRRKLTKAVECRYRIGYAKRKLKEAGIDSTRRGEMIYVAPEKEAEAINLLAPKELQPVGCYCCCCRR